MSNLINMSRSWPGGFNVVPSCQWEIRWLSYQVIMSEWVIAFVLSASACHEEIYTNHGHNLPLWPIKDNSRHPSGDTNGGNLNLLLVFRKSLSVISEKSSLHICVECVSVFLISNSRTLFLFVETLRSVKVNTSFFKVTWSTRIKEKSLFEYF